jgi:fermentation-respiration switch protein FrsA (DUF1100 family)
MATWVKVLIGVGIALVVLLVIAYFGMGYVIYDKLGNVRGDCDPVAANRPDNFALDPDWPAGFDVSPYFMTGYEAVRFPSRDSGIQVAGWWIPVDAAAPAVILVHGLGGCKNAIDMLVPAGMLWRNGFNVLLIDLRDVGGSTLQDGRSAIGNQEYRDVLGAWDWLVVEKGFDPKRIGLFANSLGGASANYAFSEEPRIAALFLQSTFGNLQQIIAAELTRNGYPALLAPAALAAGSVASGANLFARSPVDTIRKAAGRPVYIAHTRADTRIDVNQSEQLAAAAQAAGVNVTSWFPDNGEHVQTPAAYPEEFEGKMVRFFEQALGSPFTEQPTPAVTPEPSATYETHPETMRWVTDGGGQIAFDITQDVQSYDVGVSSYQFEDHKDRFTITAESGAVYQAITNVMRNPGRVRLNTSKAPTGSWTTLQFGQGAQSKTYKDVILDDDLRLIYDYVVAQLKS